MDILKVQIFVQKVMYLLCKQLMKKLFSDSEDTKAVSQHGFLAVYQREFEQYRYLIQHRSSLIRLDGRILILPIVRDLKLAPY